MHGCPEVISVELQANPSNHMEALVRLPYHTVMMPIAPNHPRPPNLETRPDCITSVIEIMPYCRKYSCLKAKVTLIASEDRESPPDSMWNM